MRKLLILIFGCFAWLASTGEVQAGMPQITYSDFGKMRLQTFSFFVIAFLILGYFFQLCWNSIRQQFTNLPKFSYRQSLGMTFLWGLVFVVILTMISGARELMTPGAWEKNGMTYRLAEGKEVDEGVSAGDAHKQKYDSLIPLKAKLFQHASKSNGVFPSEAEFIQWPYEARKIAGKVERNWVYLPGNSMGSTERILVYSPLQNPEELSTALFTDGSIRTLTSEELQKQIQKTGQRANNE